MEEYLSCQICFNLFGEGVNCPRMLQCGHSFCHSCLGKRMSVNTTRTCPTCNFQISAKIPNALPINYLFKGIATSPSQCFKKLKLEQALVSSSNTQLPVQDSFNGVGKCKDHHEFKKFRCMQCKTWICGTCATLFHKNCRTVFMEDILVELKPQLSNEINRRVKANDTQINHVSKFLKICYKRRTNINKEIEKLEICKKDTEEWMSKLIFLKSNETVFSSKLKTMGVSEKVSTDVNELSLLQAYKLEQFLKEAKENLAEDNSLLLDFRKLLTFQDLIMIAEENSVLCAETTQNKIVYSKMSAKDNRIYVHAFSLMKPSGMPIMLQYDDLVNRLYEFKEFPSRAFIRVKEVKRRITNGVKRNKTTVSSGEIVIKVDDITKPRALNLLTFCSGIKSNSYIGKEIDTIDRFGLSVGTSFLEKSEVNECGTVKSVIKIGSVIGCNSKAYKEKLSGFQIACKDVNEKTNCRFGNIEEGMDVCQKVFGKRNNQNISHYVNDCGLVFTST